MGCGQNDAAAREMAGHDGGEGGLAGDVEGRGGLVQQPDRALDRQEPGD